MTQTQKIIKYMAIALAIFLIVCIFSAILKLCSAVLFIISPDSESSALLENPTELTVSESKTIDLDLRSVSLTVKEGENFRIYTNSKYIDYSQKSAGILKITEKKRLGLLSLNNTDEILVIELPTDHKLDSFELESGAGVILIENLKSETIDFELGAGEVDIQNLYVSKKAEIEGGAGKISINGGEIAALNLDMGVGELSLTSKLTEKSSIDFGVGNAKITLIGDKTDYDLDINKGVGTIKIDGSSFEEYKNSQQQGAVSVKLDGGVGNISVDFEK